VGGHLKRKLLRWVGTVDGRHHALLAHLRLFVLIDYYFEVCSIRMRITVLILIESMEGKARES
jgi:hypothetical protein